MRTIQVATLFALITVGAAGAARAETYFSPFAGVHFGGDAGGTFGDAVDEGSRFAWGAAFGGMGAGIFGAELDVSYANNFFGEGGSDNSLLTIMPSLILGAPVGGTAGPGIRPYVTGGIGLLRRDVDLGEESVFEDSSAAYSLGFGVMGFFTDHVGIRGDYRYFRNFEADEEDDGDGIDFDAGTFDFSRASIAAVFRF